MFGIKMMVLGRCLALGYLDPWGKGPKSLSKCRVYKVPQRNADF